MIILVAVIGSYYLVVKDKKVSENQTFKIGGAFALSGDASAWGEVDLNGAIMAVEKINNEGGINGKKLELVVEDMRSTSKDAISAVQKLQNIDKVDALMVSWLDVYAGPESILKKGMILISPDAGTEAVNGTVKHPNVFSTWYRTQPKSELAIKYMASIGVKTLYMITENDSYYESVTKFTEEASKKYGVKIIGNERLNPGIDLTTSLTKIGAQKPDAVFVGFYDEKKATQFLKRYKDFLPKNTMVFGDELIEQNYSNSAYPKDGFEGIYFYSPRKQDKAFFDEYVARYKSSPVFGASTSYDTVFMIAQFLKDQPEDIDKYMRSRTFKTVSYGEVTFDDIGGITTTENYFTIKQIQNGAPADVLNK